MTRRGCGLSAAVLLLLLVAGWWFRDAIFSLAGPGEPVEVSEEAADIAESKLMRLIDDGEEIRLSEVEVSSLLRYRSQGLVEGTVQEPMVQLEGDTLVLTGTVATDSLPSHPELNTLKPLLPERAPVEVSGTMQQLERGRAAFEVIDVEFAGLPVPDRYYPEMLQKVGRRDEPNLGEHAIAIRLPPGVGSARIEAGYLILSP